MAYSFIISKARAADGSLLVLGNRSQSNSDGYPSIERLSFDDPAVMWAKVPRSASDQGTFGLQNRRRGRYLQAAYLPINIAKKEWMLQLITHEPWGPYGDTVCWHHDHFPGPYNALAWHVDWEKKINIKGDPPYSTYRSVIPWGWCGGADNELWRFWEVTAAPRAGARILLTNFEHIVQLGATPERTVYMHTNRDSWETWTVEDAGGGLFFLRSTHGTYLGSKESGEVYVTPNRDAWERWSITFNDGFRVRSAQWGRNLGSRPDGSIYTHTNCLSWERWWAPVVG